MRMKGNSLQNCERQDHFGIRKLTIGAASVLLGTTLWLTNANEIVHADENENSNDSEPQEADKSNISAPVISDNTKVQVQPQNSQSQSAIESNKQNKEIQAESSVNEKSASLSTADSKQVGNNQANQNITVSNADKTVKNGRTGQVVLGQDSSAKPESSAVQKANSVLRQQAQTVQNQINKSTNTAIHTVQSDKLQLQGKNENNEPHWQKINLAKGSQVGKTTSFKVVNSDFVTSTDLQNDKSSNQVINHHDYQNFTDQSDENGSLINSAKEGANSGSSLNKVKQVIVEPENQQETSKTDPLDLLTANFKANKKKALSLADKALANRMLFADSKVSDDTGSDTDSEPDNPSGPINPVDPTKPVEPDGPVNPESPTTPSQPTAAPSQPTVAPSDQKVTDTIVFIDDTTSTNLKWYSVEGVPGEKVNDHLSDLPTVADTIKTYIDQGYRLVSNDYQDTFENTDQVYNIHLAHKLDRIDTHNPYGQTVDKTITRKITYTVDGQPSSALPEVDQKAHFTATGVWDEVTKKVVDLTDNTTIDQGQVKLDGNGNVADGHLTWTLADGDSNFAAVKAPSVDGHHVDSDAIRVTPAGDASANVDNIGAVKGYTVTQNSDSVTINIPLVSNGTHLINQRDVDTRATVHYVIDGDDANKPAAPVDNVQDNFTYTYSGDLVDDVTGKTITPGQWNVEGSHAYEAVNSPVIAGYHTETTIVPASELTVTPNDPTVQVTVHYVRDTNNDTIYVDYHDEQGQTVGNRQVITGPIGQTISVATGVPDGWQVKPNTPFNYDFEKDYTLVTVTVDPVQAVISPDEVTSDKPFKGTDLHNEDNADVIPGTKNKRITDDITYDDLHKEVQRSVIIVDPNGAVDKNAIIQTVNFKRNATINAVTGKITFGQWQVDGKDNFKSISVPTFKGYTASQTSIAAINNVDSDFEDPHLLITYKANDNQQNIKYENAEGQVIASQVIKGKTDQNVTVKANIPDGWQLAPNEKVPSEVKIAGADTVVKIVPVESRIDPDTITQTNPLTTNDVLPGTTSKHPKQAISYQDLHKDVSRTITIKNPDGTNKTISQTVHFSRPATVNAATGNITFGQWTTVDDNNLSSVQIPEIPGYTASQSSVAAVNNVTADYSDPKLQIVYAPDEGQQTINYTDDQGHLISTQVVKGKTDQKITLTPNQIDGYHIVKSPAVPNEVTIKAKDQAVNVIVVPNKSEIKASDVTPTKDIKSTDVLPGTVNKHAKQDITYNDLHKAVSRQITVTLPSGQKQTISQVVHFQRNASVNDGTGEVTYGQWQTDGNNSLAAVNLPQVSGYLPTSNVPAINNVNHDDQDQQLNISYVKDTPANRLKIAAANLIASQSAQKANNKRLAEAKKNQETAHQVYEANQADLQKQTALVSQLHSQALSAKALLTSLMADNSSSVAAKKARENLAVLMAKIVAANQRIGQDQQAISEQKDKATKAQSTIDGLMTRKKTIDDRISQLEKDMPEAAQVLDELKKQKGYQLEITNDYARAVSAFVQGAKADYEQQKSINDDSDLNDKFHANLQRAGQAILAQMANSYSKPGAINLTENADKIDLRKVLSAEKNRTSNETWDKLNQETTNFAFTLLNSVRTQLGLEPLTLNKTARQMAAEIAQNYYNDGKSDFNNNGHDAEAVNKAAEKRNLQYVQNYGTNDPHSSHDQYYEALAGGFAKGEIKVVLPTDNGNGYGITFGLPAVKDNSYETNLTLLNRLFLVIWQKCCWWMVTQVGDILFSCLILVAIKITVKNILFIVLVPQCIFFLRN